MSVQLLVAAVDKEPEKLAETMGIQTEAIIVNQCDIYDYKEFERNGKTIRFFSMSERGVGLSRNHALLRANQEISLFADEDITYVDGYEKLVEDAFARHPKADMLLFNVKAAPGRETYWNEGEGRVHWFNCGRYPTYSMAVKTKKLHTKQITFSLYFGGGAPYSNGEDSLFIRECIRKGLRVEKVPVQIGREIPRESTWFSGYNQKFFHDRGVLYFFLYGPLKKLFALRFLLTKKGELCREIPVKLAYQYMKNGMKEAAEL